MSDVWSAWQEHTGEARQLPAAAVVEPVLPVQPHDEAAKQRPARLMTWFEETRKLSRETVELFGVYLHHHRFQARPHEDAQPALVFPYTHQGELVNRAYRLLQADVVETEPAALPCLFNADAIDADDPQEVVWAQRELDVMAVHEAGYPQAVCLPQIAGGAEDARYRAMATHEAMLSKAKRIVLAMDNTDAGVVLREELARRLGRHRCWLVQLPEGVPTIGTLLMQQGRDAVAAAITQAEPYPLEGIHRVTARSLLEIYDAPPPPTMGSGIGVLDKRVRFPMDGRFIVTLGVPNHGKTPFIRHLAVHQMEHHDRRWAVFSPEMRPWTRFVASCAQVLVGKPFQTRSREGGDLLGMTRDEVVFAANWLRRRMVMIVPDAERQSPTLAWLFERVTEAVLAEGITDVWIDPWNEIAHDRGQQREDEYLRDNLMRLLAFSARFGVNFWVNVHPHTLRPAKPGEKIQAPGPYDIAGGAMFFNKADLMFTVHRPADQAITEIYVRKAKADEYGRRGDKIEIQYNTVTGRYGTPVL
jgi:twinkle protein